MALISSKTEFLKNLFTRRTGMVVDDHASIFQSRVETLVSGMDELYGQAFPSPCSVVGKVYLNWNRKPIFEPQGGQISSHNIVVKGKQLPAYAIYTTFQKFGPPSADLIYIDKEGKQKTVPATPENLNSFYEDLENKVWEMFDATEINAMYGVLRQKLENAPVAAIA
jgi:hypothetical protein